jgi:hypothetical protein
VEFHTALVTFIDGEAQRVVAGAASWLSGQATVPWFQTGRVDDRSSDSCLQQHRIDAYPFQAVEHLGEFPFLLLNGGR